MKIKRFNNLWTMGLIIFGVILVAFWFIKLLFPDLIIGVAETKAIVDFGTYVDNHWWAYYLFTGVTSYIIAYFYCCACCRKWRLNKWDNLILVSFIVLALLVQGLIPSIYTPFNYAMFLFVPFLMNYVDKSLSKETFISTAICFSVDIAAQTLSLLIRDLTPMIHYPNSATYLILLIDMLIWRILLYCYFNKKKEI